MPDPITGGLLPEEIAAGLSDCHNCGPTERAIFAKNLCVKCWSIDRIRKKFDPKQPSNKKKFQWDAKKVATLKYFRIGLKQKIPLIAAYLGCSVAECKRAIKRYKVSIHSRGPYVRD